MSDRYLRKTRPYPVEVMYAPKMTKLYQTYTVTFLTPTKPLVVFFSLNSDIHICYGALSYVFQIHVHENPNFIQIPFTQFRLFRKEISKI